VFDESTLAWSPMQRMPLIYGHFIGSVVAALPVVDTVADILTE
jgi:hypothetical protein